MNKKYNEDDQFWKDLEKLVPKSYHKLLDWQKAGINLNPQHFETFKNNK